MVWYNGYRTLFLNQGAMMYDFCFTCQDLVPDKELVMGLCRECWKDEQEKLGLETGTIPLEKAPSKLAED